MVGYNADGPSRDRVLHLMDEKNRIESEIRDQTAILLSNNVGMHDPLVDNQGYPRNDIDVYKVRHARHQIICLQNDHKALMRQIEQGLAQVHSELLPQPAITGNASSSNSHINGHINGHKNGHTESNGSHVANNGDNVAFGTNDNGFATVGLVHNGSPADMAGLCEYDEILQFGSVNTRNFNDISQIMNIVAHSVNQPIRVVVRRDHLVVSLNVTPRPWTQPGLLGCQVLRRN